MKYYESQAFSQKCLGSRCGAIPEIAKEILKWRIMNITNQVWLSGVAYQKI
jgi:hypothetical protein